MFFIMRKRRAVQSAVPCSATDTRADAMAVVAAAAAKATAAAARVQQPTEL